MAEALYRKYRPLTFDDMVGQDHIERTLKNAIEQNKVSHAYLFCGPRGTGKTSTARILAKALLCEKGPTINPDGTCEQCQQIANGTHPDVYELDAASRTGVENVREEIISRVHYAPTIGSKKIYIIDEVHMLSPAAFNALLKTLEEPPDHVVFILCTTDPQKILETIQSRCQRFDFHRISIEEIVARLGAVCVSENVEFEPEALELIAHRADGGMRNALTSLEQIIAFGEGKVTLDGAQSILGTLDTTGISDVVRAIGQRDVATCFTWIAQYVETGADLAQFTRDLAEYIRNMYVLSMAGADVELAISEETRKAMLEELKLYGPDRLSRMLLVLDDLHKELRLSSNPRLSFEIALTRMVRPESDLTLESLAQRIEQLERQISGQPTGFAAPVSQPAAAPVAQVASAPAVSASAPVASAPAPASASAPAPMPVASPAVRPSAPAPQPRPTMPAPSVPNPAAQPMVHPAAPAQRAQGTPAFTPAQATPAQAAPTQGAPASSAPVTGGSAQAIKDPAAMQRFWHTVTTSLRKENPARGVLFMNAKASYDAQNDGILISFAPENTFAFNAAQKPEVQKLLSQVIAQVAGAPITFRIATGGGAAPAARPASVQTVAKPDAPAPQPRPTMSAPSAPASVAQPMARPAASVPNQKNASAPSAASMPASAPMPAAVPAPTSASAMTPSAQASAPMGSPASAPAPVSGNTPAASAGIPSDDSVPLDIYDSYVPEGVDDAGYTPMPAFASAPGPQSSTPASSAAAPLGTQAPAPAQQTSVSAAQPMSVPESTSVAAPVAQSVAASAVGSTEDETALLQSLLSASFGEGTKFEQVD